MMNIDEYYTLLSKESIYRLNRIASSFATKKDGPFRVINKFKINVYDDQSMFLGSVEFLEYINDLYYCKIVASPICYALDSDNMDNFYTCIRLLFWLDSCWSRPKILRCPLCSEELDVVDYLIDNKLVNYDGQYFLSILLDHIKRAHENIEVFGFKEDCMRVFLKTTLGDFEIDNSYAY